MPHLVVTSSSYSHTPLGYFPELLYPFQGQPFDNFSRDTFTVMLQLSGDHDLISGSPFCPEISSKIVALEPGTAI